MSRLLDRLTPGRLDCAKCDGTGRIDCECVECGDRHDRVCDHCGGTRTVKPIDQYHAPIDEPVIEDDIPW